MNQNNNYFGQHLFSQPISLCNKSIYESLYALYKPNFLGSTLPKTILDKLFLMDATVFSLFKAILKTNGRHSDNGKKKEV